MGGEDSIELMAVRTPTNRNAPLQLSPEDALRLNVLITQAEAVRIQESEMVVYGLRGRDEMMVILNPTGNAERYLTAVRELLAAVVLDSPGGYPVFLKRWARMGQIDSHQLDRLLRIGEPEAVMAVVCAPGLDPELARRAWWAAPHSEYARRMLEKPAIVQSEMGPILARHLFEHLPFESENLTVLETVRLILQPGLIEPQQLESLWAKGRSKVAYRVGFLEQRPHQLPREGSARHDLADHEARLALLVESGNRPAEMLLLLLQPVGQLFCQAVIEALNRPPDQDVVAAIFNVVGRFLHSARQNHIHYRSLEALQQQVSTLLASPTDELSALLSCCPELSAELEALLFLAHFDETVALPIFRASDAVGTLMRKKLQPVTAPLQFHLGVLLGR